MSRATRGIVRLSVDGESLSRFEFDKKGNAHSFTIPAGAHTLKVELEESGVLCGSMAFDREFGSGSEWTLRVDHPSPDASVSIFIVQRRQQ